MENNLLLQKDCRTGSNIELVLCVKNDYTRLHTFIMRYQFHADVVVLSCDSIESINEFIKNNNNLKFSLLIRGNKEKLTENVFIEYLNNYSKSHRALFICTDEFISFGDIEKSNNAILSDKLVYINRVDYLFYKKIKYYKKILRGGATGDFVESGNSKPHTNILCNKSKEKISVEVHHLSDQLFIDEFPKIINYIKLEIIYFSESNFPLLLAIKRYFLQFLRDIFDVKILITAGFKIYIYNSLLNIFCIIVYLLLVIESSIKVDNNKSKLIKKLFNAK